MYKRPLEIPKKRTAVSEYGELLWAIKDFSAINYWEEGIKSDPTYSSNYIMLPTTISIQRQNMGPYLRRNIYQYGKPEWKRAAMKQQLLQGYKEKLFAEADLMAKIKPKVISPGNFFETINKQSSCK